MIVPALDAAGGPAGRLARSRAEFVQAVAASPRRRSASVVARSAGKKASIASSESVMSTGVPNTVFVLLPFAAWVAWVAKQDPIARRMAWAVAAVNVLWALDSVLLLFTGWVEPTALGYAVVLAQAFVVAALAELQYVGLRRSRDRAADLFSAGKGI